MPSKNVKCLILILFQLLLCSILVAAQRARKVALTASTCSTIASASGLTIFPLLGVITYGGQVLSIAGAAIIDAASDRRRLSAANSGLDYTTPSLITTPIAFDVAAPEYEGLDTATGYLASLGRDMFVTGGEMIDLSRVLCETVDKYFLAVGANDMVSAEARRLEGQTYCIELAAKYDEMSYITGEIFNEINGLDIFSDITVADVENYRDYMIMSGGIPPEEQFIAEDIIITPEELNQIVNLLQEIDFSGLTDQAVNDGMCFYNLSIDYNALNLTLLLPDEFVSVIDKPHGGGDPEYVSLDGVHFKYDGPCQYILLTNNCPVKSINQTFFTISSRHGRARSREKHVVIISDVIIEMNDVQLLITQENQIYLNNQLLDINSSYTTKNNEMTIKKSHHFDKNFIAENEITLILNKYKIEMKVSLMNHGKVWIYAKHTTTFVCGLMGNNNGDPIDDIQLKNGTVLLNRTQQNINLMGDSWYVKYDNEPLQCRLYPASSYTSSKVCSFNKTHVSEVCNKMVTANLKSMSGKDVTKCFSDGSNAIDATRIYDDCITEICNCNSANIQACVPYYSIGLFKQSCFENGVNFMPVQSHWYL